jgi:hypothetical protein
MSGKEAVDCTELLTDKLPRKGPVWVKFTYTNSSHTKSHWYYFDANPTHFDSSRKTWVRKDWDEWARGIIEEIASTYNSFRADYSYKFGIPSRQYFQQQLEIAEKGVAEALRLRRQANRMRREWK